MRRVARHVFTILSALSLLLCVATCVLWVRSYWRCDQLSAFIVKERRQFCGCTSLSTWGFVQVEVFHNHGAVHYNGPMHEGFNWGCGSVEADNTPWDTIWERLRLGFQYEHDLGDANNPRRRVEYWRYWLRAPDWLIALILGFTPTFRIWKMMCRRERVVAGRCPVCGYDLRASPERCPECGTANPLAV
jgi:hypothetical protein